MKYDMKPIVITGGPGAGKTTLANALGACDFEVYSEGSRTLIEQQSQLDDGVLPWTDLPAFAELCLELMAEQKRAALADAKMSIMDRAIPDICAYLEQGEIEVSEAYRSESLGYHQKVFLCAPQREIYVQDDVRPHPFTEALEIHQKLVKVYQAFDYEVVNVPWGTVAERVEFMLAELHVPSVEQFDC